MHSVFLEKTILDLNLLRWSDWLQFDNQRRDEMNFEFFALFIFNFAFRGREYRRSGKEHSSRNSVISKDSMSHNLWFIWWKRRREMKEARQQGTLPLKKIRNILIVRIHARMILYKIYNLLRRWSIKCVGVKNHSWSNSANSRSFGRVNTWSSPGPAGWGGLNGL